MGRLVPVGLLAVTLIASLGCSDATEPPPSMTGEWEGSTSGDGSTYRFGLDLTQTGLSVTGGGGVIAIPSLVAIVVAVEGVADHPNVTLLLSNPSYDPITFAGTFTDRTTIAGTVSGSGFPNLPLTLVRRD